MSGAAEGLCCLLEAGEFLAAAAAACLGAQGPVVSARVIAADDFLPMQRFAWPMEFASCRYHAPPSCCHLKLSYFSRVNREGGVAGLRLFNAEE